MEVKMPIKTRVTGILIEDQKILLVKQKVTDSRNWSLPGGALEFGETLEECIIREMFEETGLRWQLKNCCISATGLKMKTRWSISPLS